MSPADFLLALPKNEAQVQTAVNELYRGMMLQHPTVKCCPSPQALLQKAQSLAKCDQKIDGQFWQFVNEHIARAARVAYGDAGQLSKQKEWSNFTAYLDREVERKLGFKKDKAHRLFPQHPNFKDWWWMRAYQEHWSELPMLQAYASLLQSGLMYALPFKEHFLFCFLPSAWHLEQGAFHAEEEPSVRFSEDFKLYHWQGVAVPEKLILSPEEITREDLIQERNAEVRRCYQERLGSARFAQLFDLELIDREIDRQGNEQKLLRSREIDPVAREHLQFARVMCPSTKRIYFLSVPPSLSSIAEAVAWTFGKSAQDYQPSEET